MDTTTWWGRIESQDAAVPRSLNLPGASRCDQLVRRPPVMEVAHSGCSFVPHQQPTQRPPLTQLRPDVRPRIPACEPQNVVSLDKRKKTAIQSQRQPRSIISDRSD